MLKKIILLIFLSVFSITCFSASELDSLLKDDDDLFSDLISEEDTLVPKDAFVEELFGQVFLQHEGSSKWLQVIENSVVKEKDTVLTMENSGVKIRMEEETYINLGSRSKIYFETLLGKPDVELMTETGLKLAWGKVYSNVRKKLEKGGRYEIEAGGVVAGVRGTKFEVEAEKTGEVKVKVFEGKVFVLPLEVYNQKKEEAKKASEEDGENSQEQTDEENESEENSEENENSQDDSSEENEDNNEQEEENSEANKEVNEEAKTSENEENIVEQASEQAKIEIETEIEQELDEKKEIQMDNLLDEIILGSDDELNIDQDGLVAELSKHDDEAPVELAKSSEVSAEIQQVTEDAKEEEDEKQLNQNVSNKNEADDEESEEEETTEEEEETTVAEEIPEELEEETLSEEIIPDKIPEEEIDEIEQTVKETVEEVVEENTSVGKLIIEIK